MNRRKLLKLSGISLSMGIFFAGFYSLKNFFNKDPWTSFQSLRYRKMRKGQGIGYILAGENRDLPKGLSHIYEAKNGTPEQNMSKILEMLGGIESIIGKHDIVVIKPNGQQIGHSMTNTNTIKGLIDRVLSIRGFKGEVIIAENHHYFPANSAGWTTQKRNGDYNLNELVNHYQERGFRNVIKYHWKDAGAVPHAGRPASERGRRVSGPEEGDGYVWTEETYSYKDKKTRMTYPIFTSAFSGITIDFKNGAWKHGKYTGQPVKFINMSALRNHSNAGVTATIKNYFGVVDLTCGYKGSTPPGYFNFHYIAVDWPGLGILRNGMKSFITSKFSRKQKWIRKVANYVGPQNGALGGAVGHFINMIRKADLNIIAAEYSGHEGRKRIPIQTKTVLASVDPVALDYYAGKNVLFPLGGTRAAQNNPDNPGGTFRKYLDLCHAQGIGTLDEKKMVVHKFNFNKRGDFHD